MKSKDFIEMKDGWQVKVYIYENHVIKRRKNLDETKNKVRKYHLLRGKSLNFINEETLRVYNDYDTSLNIIKKRKVPKSLLGNVKILNNGDIQQDRAIDLESYFRNSNLQENKEIIDKYFKFVLELWKYGISDKVWNFGSSIGKLNNKLILIDFLELTDVKSLVINDIEKKTWEKRHSFRNHLPKKLRGYFRNKADEYLNLENLEKYWNLKK